MKKSIILAATLAALSSPALAQNTSPGGGADRSLGNGNVESLAPNVPSGQSGFTGSTGSTTVPTTGSTAPPRQGNVDRTLGNGNVESQRPGVGSPMTR